MDEVARTVVALVILALVPGLVPLMDGVGQARAVAWSATGAAAQLLVVGLVIGAMFRAPWRCCQSWRSWWERRRPP